MDLQRAVPVLFVALIASAVALLWARLSGVEELRDLPRAMEAAVVQAGVEAPMVSAEALRERARTVGCGEAVSLWWRVIALEGDEIEAYKAIASCNRRDRIDEVVDSTTRAFEESELLGLVPAALDSLQVRELVPILNKVQRRSEKGATDYVFIGRSLRRLGDPAGAIGAFRDALTIDPDNAEVRLELGHALVEQGRVVEARQAFREALTDERLSLRMTQLYALAVAWPGAFLAVALGIVGVGGSLATRRSAGFELVARSVELQERRVRLLVAAVVALTLGLVAARFHATADRIAFAWLVLASGGTAAWVVLSPARVPISRAMGSIGAVVSQIASGQIYRPLRNVSAGQRFGLLLLTGFGMVFLLPLVPGIEARLLLLFLGGMLLFSTVGSLLLSMLEQLQSLQIALRWLAVAGTFPFLLFFLMFEWQDLALDLRTIGHVSAHTANRLAGYAAVWAIGLGFALLLARILSRSIVGPLGGILGAIEAVRAGRFDGRTGVRRRDEIGTLAEAVDEMAAGFRDREEIKRTFSRYVDAAVAERLLSGDVAVTQGRQVHATVLFSDVRGFTSMSEGLAPTQVVELLNAYFALMAPVVQRWGGVVDKFIGDGMLAVWDVPEPQRSGPLVGVPGERLAVEAAVDMLSALVGFNAGLEARGLPRIAIGLGINSGQLIAGPVGSPDRLEYTVVGDTVNTAQRAESVARGDAPLLVTASVADVIRAFAELEERAPVQVKGKRDALQLFKVARLVERLDAP